MHKAFSRRRYFLIAASLLALGIEIIAISSGGDASWDMRNYHLYGPFALLYKEFGTDIAPAHMQTFLPPTLDLIYYGLARFISLTPVLNAVLALPQAVAAVMAFALSWRLVQPQGRAECTALGLLGAVAATGTAALTTIATSMSEILPVVFMLGAWLTLVRPDLDTLPSFRRLFGAGLLVGTACGLKLTLTFATVAFVAILLLLPRQRLSDLVTRPIVLGLGVFCSTSALTGYWWVHQWIHYGNPTFPLMNDLFRSPHAVVYSFVDRTYLPHSWQEALSAPWSWALKLSWATGESRLRDPRFALALTAAIICVVQASLSWPRRLPWPFLVLPSWFILAFALWRAEFSIHRYLSVLELLTGTIIAMAAFPIVRWIRQPAWLPIGSATLMAACLVITVYPQVYRTQSIRPFEVDLGSLPKDSTVLLLNNEPMGYLAAFADPHVRFIATNDLYMSLDGTNPMQRDVERAIVGRKGPLFGLDSPSEQDDRSATTLAHYHLFRGACHHVVTNLSPYPIRICELSAKM
jgi:hypothetical protein